MTDDPSAPAVAYVVGIFLGFTETFLYNQMRSLSRSRAVVLCHRTDNTERFPWQGPIAADSAHVRRALQVSRRLHRLARLSPTWTAAIEAHRVSVLHAQFGPYGLQAAVYARRLGLPLVTSFYGYDVGYLLEPRAHLRAHWHYLLGKRSLFASTDLVLALSSAMKRDLVALGCPGEKISVHPNGVDLERFRPSPDVRGRTGPVTVVLCGSEVEKKGFEYGFLALRRALDQGAYLRARWVRAPGPRGEALRARIEELGLGPHLEVLPPSTDVAKVMAGGDLMLAPSVTAANGDKEGVPTVLVEAAASGLPAIASRHAGIPEIVADGESGLLYPERDVEGLAAGLRRLAGDADLRRRMGAAARRRAEETYDARRLAVKLEDHYDELRRGARSRAAAR